MAVLHGMLHKAGRGKKKEEEGAGRQAGGAGRQQQQVCAGKQVVGMYRRYR